MSIVTALFGADGRAATAHTSLLLAYGLALTGRPTTLIRVVGEFDGLARFQTGLPRALEIVEHRVEAPELAGLGIDAHLSAALRAGQRVVLDMPLEALSDPGLRERITLPVLLVGPSALDERLAAQVLSAAGSHGPHMADRDGAIAPLWLLGCGRSGGNAATFEAAMRGASAAEGLPHPVRTLPLTVPCIGRFEADALTRGRPGSFLLRRAILNLAALEIAAADPFAPSIDRAAFVRATAASRPGAATVDDRPLQERLRDLADALAELEGSGNVPAPEDLAEAPVLDDFAFIPDPRARIMRGIVQGHPNWPDPRLVTTSQVYATDGRTWARTLSRLYRLRQAEGHVVTH